MLLILVPFINLQKTLFAFHLIIDTATENESPPTFVTLITDSSIRLLHSLQAVSVLPDRGYGLFYVKEMILHADFTKLLILPFLVDISVLSMFG